MNKSPILNAERYFYRIIGILFIISIFIIYSQAVLGGNFYDNYDGNTYNSSIYSVKNTNMFFNNSGKLRYYVNTGTDWQESVRGWSYQQYNLTNFTMTWFTTDYGSSGTANEWTFKYNGLNGTAARMYQIYCGSWTTTMNWNYWNGVAWSTIKTTTVGSNQCNTKNLSFSITANGNEYRFYRNGTLLDAVNMTNITGAGYVGYKTGGGSFAFYHEIDWLNITSDDIPSAPPAVTYSYTVTNTQTPTDINSSYAGILQINSTIGGDNRTTNGTATLYTKIVTSLSGCAQYYATTCAIANNTYFTHSMTEINDSYFYHNLYDTDYYPAYYPYNYTKIDNGQHFNYSLYNNNYIKWNVWNLSTASDRYFIDIEVDAYNLSGQPLDIWYCNSSYSTGNPVSNVNCELIDAFTPIGQPHTHNNSRHYAIPVTITIPKTQNSSFLFIAQVPLATGWRIGYINDSGYDNKSFMIGNYISWADTYHVFDIHLHEFRQEDRLSYYTNYSDGIGNWNISAVTNDFYNITNLAPNAPLFYAPCAEYDLNSSGSFIFFNWSASQDLNNDTFTYNLSIYNDVVAYYVNQSIPSNQTTYTWIVDNEDILSGTYYSYMRVCDSFGNCDTATSDCSFYACISDWEYSLTPCVGGVRQINYVDMNSCTTPYD